VVDVVGVEERDEDDVGDEIVDCRDLLKIIRSENNGSIPTEVSLVFFIMVMVSNRPFFPIFVITTASFIMVTLCTFSTPFNRSLYYLWADTSGGVIFGGWGFCFDNGSCSSLVFGYTWVPDFVAGLIKTLVFYPIADIFTFIAWLCLIPSMIAVGSRVYPIPIFTFFAWCSFLSNLLAFVLMLAIFGSAHDQFISDGIDAAYGPLPWLSLATTIIMAFVTLHATFGAPTNVYFL